MLHYDRGTQYTSALYRSTLRKNEELPDSTVVEVIVKLVSNPKFAAMMHHEVLELCKQREQEMQDRKDTVNLYMSSTLKFYS